MLLKWSIGYLVTSDESIVLENGLHYLWANKVRSWCLFQSSLFQPPQSGNLYLERAAAPDGRNLDPNVTRWR